MLKRAANAAEKAQQILAVRSLVHAVVTQNPQLVELNLGCLISSMWTLINGLVWTYP